MTSVTPVIAQNHLKAEYIADILWHIYGDASETLLDGVQTTFSRSFEHSSAAIFKAARRSQTPRDGDGDGYVFDGTPQQRRATPEESGSHLFKRKNSDERIAEIHASVEKALAGERTSKSANELTDMLSELTVKQLRDIKIKYGMKASGRTKAEFVAKIAKRLDAGRRADQSALPGIKLSEDTKYWLKPILRVHQENRSADDEQRKMVESVIGGKHLTPKQKTQAIDLFQRKYNELNSTLGIVGNRQGENQSKAVESVLSKLGVNAREQWKKSGGSVNQFPTVAQQPAPQQERMVEPVMPTRAEIQASQPPLRSASDRAARARAEVLAARASQSDKPVVAPIPVVAKPVSAPTVQYTEDQIMQGQVIGRAERALERQKAGTWNGPDISREDVERLRARFPNAAPRNAISKALFSRAMMLKGEIRDADGDGMIYDGTPQERPAGVYADRLKKLRERRGENKDGVSMAVTESPEFKEWFGDSKIVDENGKPAVVYHGTNAEFTQFDKSDNVHAQMLEVPVHFFTSDKDLSAAYAASSNYKNDGNEQVMPVYLRMENPLEIDANGKQWIEVLPDIQDSVETYRTEAERKFKQFRKDMAEKYAYEVEFDPHFELPDNEESEGDRLNKEFTNELISGSMKGKQPIGVIGYDGIIIRNVWDRPPIEHEETEQYNPFTDVYAVFDSTQIKSAIGNSGEFSRHSGDIRKSASATAMFFREARPLKDGDGDGVVNDGTPQERPVDAKQDAVKESQKTGVKQSVTESPEFKQWFGQSKVVDEQGKPKVLYHATTEEFKEFKNPYAESGITMFTTDPEYSNLHISGQGKTSQSVPVYMSAERPLDLRSIPSMRSDAKHKMQIILEDAAENASPEQQAAIKAISSKLESERDIYMIVNRSFRSKEMKELLYKAGFDSIVMNDNRKGVDDYTGNLKEVEAQSWVVFDSAKVKSSIGNSGKFSRESADISKAVEQSAATMTKADKPPKDADGDGLVNDGTPQEAPVSGTQPEQKQPERNVAPLPQRDDRLRTRDKVTDAIVGTIFGVKKDIESINGSVKPREGVTPEQEQAYRQVLNDALKQFPPGMIDNIGKNLKSVEMHKDMWSITKEVHERDGEEYNGKSITFGFFDPRSGSVHLDGNLPEGLALKSGGDFSQRGLYAHELAHAADKLEDGTYFSKSKGWSDAYAAEINTAATPLSKYATVSPSEGFAEFVRYATENPQEARKNFPKSMKSVESRYGRM